jgi:hypothetical protein
MRPRGLAARGGAALDNLLDEATDAELIADYVA